MGSSSQLSEFFEQQREDRRREILNEMRQNFMSNMLFIKYLESSGSNADLITDSNVLLRQKAIFSSFLMLLWKDDFITKDEDQNILSNLSEELLNDIVKIIAIKDNDKWKVGNIEFENSYDVIEKIKNKVAHGDYLINEDYLEFNINNKIGKIPIDYVVDFTIAIANKWNKISKYGENKESYVCVDVGDLIPKRIKNEQMIKKAFECMSLVELVDKPSNGYQRNKEYQDLVQDYISNFYRLKNQNDESYKLLPAIYEMKLKELGIDLQTHSTPFILLPEIDKVIDHIKVDKSFLKEKNLKKQINYLAFSVYEKYTKNGLKTNISDGIALNQNILNALEFNNNTSFNYMFGIDDSIDLPQKIKIDKAIVAAYLTAFYGTYIYGLDKILTDDERNKLSRIYEQKMFDFSKLDINISFDVMVIKKTNKEFLRQLKCDKDSLENIQKKYMTISKNIHNTRNSILQENDDIKIKKKKKALEKQKNALKEKYGEYATLKRKVDFEDDFIKNKLDKHTENKSIVEHIRNSISHGNIEFNFTQSSGDRNEIKLHFIDYDKENPDMVTFESVLTLKQFNELFSPHNIKELSTFLDENKKLYDADSERSHNSSEGIPQLINKIKKRDN